VGGHSLLYTHLSILNSSEEVLIMDADTDLKNAITELLWKRQDKYYSSASHCVEVEGFCGSLRITPRAR